ncbi:hypothetical protein M0812_10328 [Anaeramoeba flamelloides]|uniref:Uncharacterized protein n=1 Tax=Anaeramoeba flamelloides TaxID=1746091 RepID=A0AAV7ZX56_9EUKA|nr:hypothetical protein M0812_10328 [Anaeramoeba flamelloides]
MKIIEQKICDDLSSECPYCKGSGINYIVAEITTKKNNKKTKTKIKYYFNDQFKDNMVQFCRCGCQRYNCKKCLGTGIYTIYDQNKIHYIKDYDNPSINYCKNCPGFNCHKCRGFGFTSIKLIKGMLILTKEQYKTKTIGQAKLCQSCIRSLNVKNCNLCSGFGTVLQNVKICTNCSGYGFTVTKIKNQYKYKECQNCQGKGIPYKSCIELNIEECKSVIKKVVQFKQFLTEIKLKYTIKMNDKVQEFLFANEIYMNEKIFNQSIVNETNYPRVLQSLKDCFSSIRDIEEHMQKNLSKNDKKDNRLLAMQLYTIKSFSNWSHHSFEPKEHAGRVICEKDLINILDLVQEVVNEFNFKEIIKIPKLNKKKKKKKKKKHKSLILRKLIQI